MHLVRTMFLLSIFASLFFAADKADSRPPIRIGVSSSLMNLEVNANDARAAIKVWAEMLARESGVRMETPVDIFSPPDQLLRGLREGAIDFYTAPLTEYHQAAVYLDPSMVLVDESYANAGEEYIILVHAGSGITSLAGLRGRSLIRYESNVMNLAPIWLENLLMSSNLGVPDAFFSQIVPNLKISRTVLPVFFRQSDACLVTRRSFATMAEMNPQLSAQLRVVAASPKLIPVVVAFARNCPPRSRDLLQTSLLNLNSSPAGRQILALFGSRRIVAADTSLLGQSLELINSVTRGKGRGTRQ